MPFQLCRYGALIRSTYTDLILIFQGDKSSRAQILKKASEYIAFMRRKNGSHATDIEDLRRQNAHLENQVLNVLEDFPVEDFN